MEKVRVNLVKLRQSDYHIQRQYCREVPSLSFQLANGSTPKFLIKKSFYGFTRYTDALAKGRISLMDFVTFEDALNEVAGFSIGWVHPYVLAGWRARQNESLAVQAAFLKDAIL